MKTERGFTLEGGNDYRHPKGFRCIEDRDAPYRFVWLKRDERKVLTYCEGDLILETCESDEELTAHLEKLRAFYGKLDEEEIACAA